MGNRRQITLAAEVESLAVFRRFIEEGCREAGVDNQSCYDIKLAVDEACTNIIQHGYAGMEPGSIVLSLQYGARQVVVRLSDFGHPFEPCEPPESGAGKHGFGLLFIYRSMDSVSYEAAGGCNTMTMVKRLDTPGKTP
ncbi:MAG: ATP-binding protein [Candidatus Promineifilaceae bacterium]|jgi:anti-sigma regulatory factor (Ser/Thr protein kinase)